MGTCASNQQPAHSDDGQFRNNQSHYQHHQESQAQTQSRSNRRFNPFYQANSQSSQEQTIFSQYNFHSNYDDKFLGRCSILEHKQTRNFYLSKEIQFSKDDEYNLKLKEFLTIQDKLSHQNIIQVKHIIQKQSEGFFTQRKKLIVIVDYPLTNLQRQYNNRVVKNLQFSREEILNILISCVKGYSIIQRERELSALGPDSTIFRNDKIRLKNLFFGIKNKESLIKIAQSSLLNEKANLENIFKNQYDVPSNRDIYLAPEQFQAYIQKNKKHPHFQKAGVFSFGMSILDLCLMNSSRQAYLYDDKIMDFNEIRNRILIAGKKYGPIIQRFLGDMLQIDDRKRPNFQELESKIPSLLISRNVGQSSRMNLSVARSNSHYLRNNPRSISRSRSRESSVRSRSNSRGSMNRSIGSKVSTYSASNSRFGGHLGRRMRGQREDLDDLDRVHQVYDKEVGRQYIGQKKGTAKHGHGKYQFERDGAYYQGQWRNNKIQGKGQSYFRYGQVQYSGQWKADQYHGWGTLYSNPQGASKWQKYQGQFKNGMKEGRGQMKFRNGMSYDGEFRGDKIHGRGKLIQNGKVIKDGYWELVNPDKFLQENKIQDD